MKYESLIRQAILTLNVTFTLAELLSCIDALNKSVPSLAELNEAFAQIKNSGDFSSHDWNPVTHETYLDSVAYCHKEMVCFMESQGFSYEQIEQVFSTLQ